MRIIHLSDLHFGSHDQKLADGLAEEISRQNPDLVVVSGDFTQVGSAEEFRAARRFIDQIKVPLFAVPGNHDLPAYNLLLRFLDPYKHYRRYIAQELEPFAEFDNIALSGIKTSRRLLLGFNWSHGSISHEQLEELETRFSAIATHKLRIVVAHHPLMQPEQPMAQPMRLVKRADRAMQTFGELGVRLVLSGHFHLSYVRHHRIEQGSAEGPLKAAAAPIVVVQAASTISTRLRGHANAYNVIDTHEGNIVVRLREWGADGWATRPDASSVPLPPAAPPETP